MSDKHTNFREAVMRAWVMGWNAGRIRVVSDGGKIEAADKLERGFPAEAHAGDLLDACEDLKLLVEGLMGDDGLQDHQLALYEKAVAVLAKAQGENR